ncbi:MAG: serine hydrolase [Myxococcales bacterium]|nr:serine hydrolase [Myxococcales bacterium]
MTLLPWIVACAGQEPDVEGTGSTGGSEAGDGTEHGDTASTDQADGSSDDGASSSDTADTADTDDTGEPPAAGPDRVGIFSAAHNYYELDVEGGPLRFHFGAENSRWGAATLPVAGDFDGDGFDTVGRYDPLARRFHLADDNDSDELSPRGQVHAIVGVPPAPAVSGEQPAELPVAGDWDGDGADGVGVYHPGTHTFHLLDDPASGQASWEVVLDPAEGYPELGWPVAGDFDGDGDDEGGLFAAGTAYIADDLQGGPPALTLSIGGTVALAGDFDDDGIDTLAGFDVATNTFEWLHHNGAGAATESLSFGHAEPGFWAWAPLTGRWQVPAQPVARDGYAWQEGDPADHGLDGAQLLAALDDAASLADVLGVLVVRHGTLVAERYYHGYDRNIAGNIKSVSKGMLSALYGIALDEGIFASVDDPVAQHLPEYFAELSPAKQQIRLGDLLTMRGGLEWNEGPGYVSGGMVAAPDFCRFVLELPLVETPGTVFEYSTGLTHVASAALTESSGDTTREFARARLLEPLGISTPRWDLSPEGYFVGGAEVWMRPRDMARLGQLYLEGGTLDGQAVLTPEWVELSANPWIPEASGRTYGVWWRERPWASYPAQDSYFAWGYGGQFIFLFPSWDLQVVVTSKWNVSGTASGAAATAIFAFVDQQLLTAVQD